MFKLFSNKVSNPKDLFSTIIQNKIPHSNWISNLLLPVTEQTTLLINKFLSEKERLGVEIFLNKQDQSAWYNVPFQYTPYWDSFKFKNV